jgi:hypothetical protein
LGWCEGLMVVQYRKEWMKAGCLYSSVREVDKGTGDVLICLGMLH